MPKRSAGLILFKREAGDLRVLLVHPGGPFWQKRDLGSWSIPKGEYVDGEDPRAIALREFEEETGVTPPAGDLLALGDVRQAGGKVVTAWAIGVACVGLVCVGLVPGVFYAILVSAHASAALRPKGSAPASRQGPR